jgi:hypothetical protein
MVVTPDGRRAADLITLTESQNQVCFFALLLFVEYPNCLECQMVEHLRKLIQ